MGLTFQLRNLDVLFDVRASSIGCVLQEDKTADLEWCGPWFIDVQLVYSHQLRIEIHA